MPRPGGRGAGDTRSTANCFTCQSRDRSEWSILKPAELDLLNGAKTVTRYAGGQGIFHQGSSCVGIHCLEAGTVAVRRTGAHGGEAITSLHQPGETLGYRAYFGGGVHGGTAYAVTECRVCFFRSDTVRELLERNPALGFRFLERMAHDLEQANDTLLACRSLSARARIAHTLLVLKDRFDRVDEQGNIELTLPLSRTDLACLVGVRPESLSRGIRQLEAAGVAHFRGKQVVVPDLDALLDEIEGDEEAR